MSIPSTLTDLLISHARAAGAARLVLFGSRARGDFHERSDVDLAAFGVPADCQAAFRLALDDLPTLLKFDLVFIDEHTSPDLLAEIQRDGVTLYENED